MILAINFVFCVFYLLIIAAALLPWFSKERDHWISRLADPFLNPIREGLPPQKMGMDFSPFIAILVLLLVHRLLVKIF